MVHFPPWLAGAPALQASLAALDISFPGESAGNFRENGSLSPAAGRGAGSTAIYGGTWHFHLRGKCRVFRRKRFTFPRGGMGYRLYRHLWRHLTFPSLGKVPGFPAKTVHFPPCGVLMKIQQSKRPGPPTASRRAPPSAGKVPGFSAKMEHFPRGLEKDRMSNGGIDVIGYSAPFSFSVLMLIHGDRLCGKGGFSRYFATFVV